MNTEETEENKLEQPPALQGTWGIKGAAPLDAAIVYGARAIYGLRDQKTKHGRGWTMKTIASIEFCFDRMQMIGGADPDRKAFAKWLDAVALPELKELCVSGNVTTDSDVYLRFERDGYALVASPRGSYGYLYISAWIVP